MIHTYLNRAALTSLAVVAAVVTAGAAVAQPATVVKPDGVNDTDVGPAMQAEVRENGKPGKTDVPKKTGAETSGSGGDGNEYVLVRPASAGVDDEPQRIEVGGGERPQVAYPPSVIWGDESPVVAPAAGGASDGQ